MTIALIIAGGKGERVGQDIPKQFLVVRGKPIIVHTMEKFQAHPNIDEIVVVCLDGWQDILLAYCRQFGITKLKSVVFGGESGQESILHGLFDIKTRCSDKDIVMIHEAVRPMVSADVISDSLRVCSQFGGAVAALPCIDAMLEVSDSDSLTAKLQIQRSKLMRAQNPHTFPLGKLLWAHAEARKRGIKNSVATSTLMIELGQSLNLSAGSEKNFKLTTYEDIEIFEALLCLS